jgi:hypothetical protein
MNKKNYLFFNMPSHAFSRFLEISFQNENPLSTKLSLGQKKRICGRHRHDGLFDFQVHPLLLFFPKTIAQVVVAKDYTTTFDKKKTGSDEATPKTLQVERRRELILHCLSSSFRETQRSGLDAAFFAHKTP